MNIAEIVVVFIIGWWLILLAALPIGVRRDETPSAGNDHGAPVKTMLGRKVLITTLLAAVLTTGFYWVTSYSGFSLREFYRG